MQRAAPIFHVERTPVIERLEEIQDAHADDVIVVGGLPFISAVPNGLGFRSAAHALLVPPLDKLRAVFDDLSEEAFRQTFNRYNLLYLSLTTPPDWTRPLLSPLAATADATLVPPWYFLPRLRAAVHPLAALPEGLPPAEGRVVKADLEGRRMRLILQGPVPGVAGGALLQVYADDAVDSVEPYAYSPDKRFDLTRGAALCSDAVVDVRFGQPFGSAREIGMCLIVTDDGGRSWRIAMPRQAGGPVCPADGATTARGP